MSQEKLLDAATLRKLTKDVIDAKDERVYRERERQVKRQIHTAASSGLFTTHFPFDIGALLEKELRGSGYGVSRYDSDYSVHSRVSWEGDE